MSVILLILGANLIALGVALFMAGTVGVIRLPDALSRFHALTKIDNLALGCICFGLMMLAQSALTVVILLCIWVLAMISGAIGAQIVASHHEANR